VKTLVYARHRLVDPSLDAHVPALLLEGSWPGEEPTAWRASLDDAIDGRFEWIDLQASHWAEHVGQGSAIAHGRQKLVDAVTPAYLNALALRYYLVKLIRVVAYFTESRPLGPRDALELVAARGRDEDYADLLAELANATGAGLEIRWSDAAGPAPLSPARNGRFRRGLGKLAGLLEPAIGDVEAAHRAVLCGNPRLLDPVCRELLDRGARVWWLHDRFAVRSWLAWRASGVGQLVCDCSLGDHNHLAGCLPGRLLCRDVNLTPALGRWLAERMRTHGRGQTRSIDEIERHFRRIRPDSLVLCEDATPFARAAVAVARRQMVASFVLQHGVPGCRFGFAPLAADRMLVWGQSSKRQLVDWGVSPERIQITGSPQHDARLAKFRQDVERIVAHRVRIAAGPKPNPAEEPVAAAPSGVEPAPAQALRPARILLLGTVPPRDGRPDSVVLHFNRRTYAEMLRMTLSSLARLSVVRVMVKPHPRASRDRVFESAMAAHPALPVEVVRKGDLRTLASRSDCVVSFFSSAGVEAAVLGVPVVQVLPPGSGNFLPHGSWNLAGSARSESELDRLLARVLSGGWSPDGAAPVEVFDNVDRPAAPRVVDAILAAEGRRIGPREPVAASEQNTRTRTRSVPRIAAAERRTIR
jgi:hypothetical protein